jgi:hypothetical protein
VNAGFVVFALLWLGAPPTHSVPPNVRWEVRASHLGFLEAGQWEIAIRVPGWSTLHRTPTEAEREDARMKSAEYQFRDDRISVPPPRLAELRDAIRRERFFELRDKYGEPVIDGHERRIEIHDAGKVKEVTIYTVYPRIEVSDSERDEIRRALRVWIAIRNCFVDREALDSRPQDREFLAANPSSKK